jgi:putative hydrolase of the HAD superfamily
MGAPAPRLRALVVDYGGVLTTSLAAAMQAWLAADEIDPADFGDLMRQWLGAPPAPAADANPIHALETGAMSAQEFECRLAERLRTRTGTAPTAEGLLGRMFAQFRAEPSMLTVLGRARRHGIRTALLSNSWGLDYPRDGWDELFDVVVISGEVGLRKPDPAIYRLVAERLDVAPEECVFVDDLSPNVRAAAAVGMVGIHHTDPVTTVAELEAVFDLPFGEGLA